MEIKSNKLEKIVKSVAITLALGTIYSSGCSQSEKKYDKVPTTQKYDFDKASPMDGLGL